MARRSGAVVWQYAVPLRAGATPIARLASRTLDVVAADEERVYVATMRDVRALRARDGALLWIHPFPPILAPLPGVELLSAGDALIVSWEASDSLTVLDPRTGATRWALSPNPPVSIDGVVAFARAGTGQSAAPERSHQPDTLLLRELYTATRHETPGNTQLTITDTVTITAAVDLARGTSLWRRQVPGTCVVGRPVVTAGRADGVGGAVVVQACNGALDAWAATDSTPRWHVAAPPRLP